jgi:hypothetical protein
VYIKPFWMYRVGKNSEKDDFEHIMKNYIFGFSSTIQHRWLKLHENLYLQIPNEYEYIKQKYKNTKHIFLFLWSAVVLST